MRRLFYIYYSACLVWVIRVLRNGALEAGEWMKRSGRTLVLWGAKNESRWSIDLLRQCYLVDMQIHLPGEVYRGPVYLVCQESSLDGTTLVCKFNWVTRRKNFSAIFETAGFCAFKLKNCGKPTALPNGDVWFSFGSGYAVLFLGEPREKHNFIASLEIPRVYTYF